MRKAEAQSAWPHEAPGAERQARINAIAQLPEKRKGKPDFPHLIAVIVCGGERADYYRPRAKVALPHALLGIGKRPVGKPAGARKAG